VSAGALVGAAYASGTGPAEIARFGSALRFGDVARWSFCKLGLCCTDGMSKLLSRLLKRSRFEEMRIPLSVAATDLQSGDPVIFQGTGDVNLPIRASCAFPGIFQPVRWNSRILTDGVISMEVPAMLAREMGATRVISVSIPHDSHAISPSNLIDVVGRSLQILQMRTESSWRGASDLVIVPDVCQWSWHDFKNSARIIEAGAVAARKAVPEIKAWLKTAAKPAGNVIPFPPAA
jgi:NTE family protein